MTPRMECCFMLSQQLFLSLWASRHRCLHLPTLPCAPQAFIWDTGHSRGYGVIGYNILKELKYTKILMI